MPEVEDNIHRLWEEVGNISGRRKPEDRLGPKHSGHLPKSRRGLGYSIREAKARPSNASFGELLGNDAYTGAVLSFLWETGVGKDKDGAIDRGVEY